MRIAILGPGGIGGFLAGLFSKHEFEVICIAKSGFEPKNGIHVRSTVFGNFTVYPRITTTLDRDVDILFVATKAIHLREALDSIPPERVVHAIIIPLLNGLGHVEILREKFGPSVAVGMIGAIEAKSEKAGFVEHLTTQVPHLELASDHDISRERLKEIADVLKNAGLNISVLNSEAQVIWNKLVRLNAIASATAAAEQPVGFVRSDPEWRPLLEGAVREGAAVAEAEGAHINPEEVMKQIDNLPATLTTSLQRDVEKKNPSEVESITGAVMRRAEAYGIACPAIKTLYQKIINLT